MVFRKWQELQDAGVCLWRDRRIIGANQGNILEATVTAVSAMGICGDMPEKAKGTGTLKVHLIDAMSNIDETWMERSNQIESRS